MDEAQIAALFAKLMAPVTEQLTGLSGAIQKLQTATPPVPPVVPPAPPVPPVVPPAPPAPGVSPELNSQLLDLRKSNEKLVSDLAALNKAREDADKRADESERNSVVSTALNGFQFATDAARATAAEKVLSQIKRTDVGTLIAGDNLTVEAFTKDFIPRDHAYLLAPVAAGGSAITPGQHRNSQAPFDMNSIKPGMTAEQRQQAGAAIRAALPQQ